jgi:hypothetical protein
VLPDRIGELAEFSIGKRAARIARIGFDEFDRDLALRAWPLQMRGLAADISDQAIASSLGFNSSAPVSLRLRILLSSFRGAREAGEPQMCSRTSGNLEAAERVPFTISGFRINPLQRIVGMT